MSIGIEVQGCRTRISALSSTHVDRDETFIVRVKGELELILSAFVGGRHHLDGLFPYTSMILQCQTSLVSSLQS